MNTDAPLPDAGALTKSSSSTLYPRAVVAAGHGTICATADVAVKQTASTTTVLKQQTLQMRRGNINALSVTRSFVGLVGNVIPPQSPSRNTFSSQLAFCVAGTSYRKTTL